MKKTINKYIIDESTSNLFKSMFGVDLLKESHPKYPMFSGDEGYSEEYMRSSQEADDRVGREKQAELEAWMKKNEETGEGSFVAQGFDESTNTSNAKRKYDDVDAAMAKLGIALTTHGDATHAVRIDGELRVFRSSSDEANMIAQKLGNILKDKSISVVDLLQQESDSISNDPYHPDYGKLKNPPKPHHFDNKSLRRCPDDGDVCTDSFCSSYCKKMSGY